MKAYLTALRLAAVLWYCEIATVDGRVDRYIELAAAPLEPRPVFPSDEYASLTQQKLLLPALFPRRR